MLIEPKTVPIILKLCQHNREEPISHHRQQVITQKKQVIQFITTQVGLKRMIHKKNFGICLAASFSVLMNSQQFNPCPAHSYTTIWSIHSSSVREPMDTEQFGLTSTRYHSTFTTGPDSTHFCRSAAAWMALPSLVPLIMVRNVAYVSEVRQVNTPCLSTPPIL